jgi:hypothetical protein
VSDITLPHAEKEGGEVMVGGGPAPGDDRTGGAARIWFTGSVLPRVGAATGPGGYLRSTLADEQHATFEARPHDLCSSTEPAPSDGACMTVPAGWPPLALPGLPRCTTSTWLSITYPTGARLCLSEKDWAVNLRLYATQPERLLQLQCEGERWCSPPDARAQRWAGHGRGPTSCVFESQAVDEGATMPIGRRRSL